MVDTALRVCAATVGDQLAGPIGVAGEHSTDPEFDQQRIQASVALGDWWGGAEGSDVAPAGYAERFTIGEVGLRLLGRGAVMQRLHRSGPSGAVDAFGVAGVDPGGQQGHDGSCRPRRGVQHGGEDLGVALVGEHPEHQQHLRFWNGRRARLPDGCPLTWGQVRRRQR